MSDTIIERLNKKTPMVPSSVVSVMSNENKNGNPDSPLQKADVQRLMNEMVGGVVAQPTGENNSPVAEQNNDKDEDKKRSMFTMMPGNAQPTGEGGGHRGFSIKVKDYLPGGNKSKTWGGLLIGGAMTAALGGLIGSVLGNNGKFGKFSSIVNPKTKGALSKVKSNVPGVNEKGKSILGANSFNSAVSSLSPMQKELLNSDDMERLRQNNNKQIISKNYPFIGGLTSNGLDKAKKMVVNGEVLSADNTKIYEKMGLASDKYFLSSTPKVDEVRMSWGDAFMKVATSPEFISTATTTIIDAIPGLSRRVDDMQDRVNEGFQLTGVTPEEILNISSEQEAYILGLKAIYNNMSEEDKDLLRMYKYYKMNMNYRNDPNINPDGTGYNLGQEVSDSFFGSVNYNVTNFLDGASDYISETYENFTHDVSNWVEDQFEQFNKFSDSFEQATGIKLDIPREYRDKVYDTMEKLGFGNPGLGTDTRAYIVSTLLQKTYVSIQGGKKGSDVNIDPGNVSFYYERYDYRDKLTAERRLKVKLTNVQLSQIDLHSEDLTITVKRRYGFSLGQSPNGTYPADFNTEFTDIERDFILEWPAKVVGDKTVGSKKDQAEIARLTEDGGEIDPRVAFKTQEVEFIITPPELIGNHTDDTINGIADGENTISEILDSAFNISYETGVSCIAKPKNDFVLKDVAIPPTNFEGLLKQFQKEYDIYEGGPVIFHDQLAINEEPEDVYFVLPKRGVAELDFEAGWTVEFRVRNIKTPTPSDMICFIEPSRKKIIWPITENDIKVPGDSTRFSNTSTVKYAKGSTIGAQQPGDKKALNHELVHTNTEYSIPNRQENPNFDHIYIKVPNTFVTFTPGDMVTVKWREQSYKANVKEWASEYVNGVRIVLLVLICKPDISKQTFIDKYSPAKWIEKMQEKVAETNTKITSKLNDWSDKTGNWLQQQFETFSKWEDEHLKFKGHNILEWLNMVDPDIEVPEFDQEANYKNTDIEYLRKLYKVDYDDPFSYGTLYRNNTSGLADEIKSSKNSWGGKSTGEIQMPEGAIS